MTLTEKKPEDKIFGKNVTKIVSIRVPENQYESILTVVKEYVSNFREDNVKKIEALKDSIEEIVSIYLDIDDYIQKEKSITSDKYHSILFDHNKVLVNKLIEEYPIERKTPIKTLTEEEIEEELRKEALRKKTRLKTGWEGFGINYDDYLKIKKLRNKERTRRAKKLWNACYKFYGMEAFKRTYNR